MNDGKDKVDYEIVEQVTKSALGGLLDGILDSLGGLEADMRKTDELARFMGMFDTALTVRDRLDNGICLISEGTIDSLRMLLEPYTKVEAVGVKVAAKCVLEILSDLMVHGGIVVIAEGRCDDLVQCLEDLIVTIEGIDDRTDNEEGDDGPNRGMQAIGNGPALLDTCRRERHKRSQVQALRQAGSLLHRTSVSAMGVCSGGLHAVGVRLNRGYPRAYLDALKPFNQSFITENLTVFPCKNPAFYCGKGADFDIRVAYRREIKILSCRILRASAEPAAARLSHVL